jgi:putative ABC transport system permease protein
MAPQKRDTPFWYLRRTSARVQAEIDEEIEGHLQMRIEELQARGIPIEDARREAVRRFGNIESTRRYCRNQDERRESAMQRTLTLQDLGQDITTSLRSLARAPILTLTILLTVGLGIGATTVIFAAIEAAFLRPLPYARPDTLVWIYTDTPPFQFRFSAVDYLALEAQQTHFESIGAFTDRTMTFTEGADAEVLNGRAVSWSYFRTLGIAPLLGRDFTKLDATPGTAPGVIVSHAFWQQRLGSRRNVLGSPIRLDGAAYQLVGVLPARTGPLERQRDFFLVTQFSTPPRRGPFPYWVVGRLKNGVSHTAAASELRTINRRIFPIWRSSYQDDRATWSLVDLKTRLVGDTAATGGVAIAAVVLVWLMACLNASNLLIARLTSRRRELAIRAALGASRARVMRFLLVESALLATGAAAIGIAAAWSGVGLVQRIAAIYFPLSQEIAFDGAVIGVLFAIVCFSLLMFGAIPSMQGTAGPIDDSLRSVGRSSTGSRSARRLRHALVASQFALSTPLLIVAALLLVSLNQLKQVDLGFDRTHMVTGSVQLPAALYRDQAHVTSYWDELARRLSAVPGVAAAAFADSLPPETAYNINNFDLEERPTTEGQSQPATPWVAATPDYFRALGLKPLEGRLLEERDAQTENLESVVVDRAWAHRFFPGASAIGKRFKEGGCTACPWTTVVGVVKDVKYSGLNQPDPGTVYSPMAGGLSRFVVIRTRTDPRGVVPSLRQAVRSLDPNVALTSLATADDLVAQSLERPTSLSILVGSFAIVALILSIVGIYGVMSYYVMDNRREISIRLALGGTAPDVLRLVVGRGMTVVVAGLAIGIGLAFASTRLLSTLLFGVGAADPATLASVSVSLLAIALAACLLPARQAVRLEPAAVLRNE